MPVPKKKIGIFSFFAGAGFLDLGFEKAGFDVLYVNEIHRPFLDAYTHSRAQMGIQLPKFGVCQEDISSLAEKSGRTKMLQLMKSARKTHQLIGFIGGPPCPDFSVGGKNRGMHGENGKLSATYVDLIVQQQPDFFLFENVKGLWRTKKHRAFFEELKRKLHKVGYVTTERLINAIEFGAPQDRDRIILLGFKKDILSRSVTIDGGMIRDGLFPWLKHIRHERQQAFDIPWPTTNPFKENGKLAKPSLVPEEYTVEHWFKKNDVENHPNTKHVFTPRQALARFKSIPEGDDLKKSFKRLHRWRYSPTACYGNNEVHIHPYKARRITVAEALAIQSLPKKFELPGTMTLTDMFKTIGNGVPFLAAKGLAVTIRDFMSQYA
jgi:DNA (cytosine-5)-methyltransferase 1